MNSCRRVFFLCMTGQLCGDIFSIDDLPEFARDHIIESLQFRMAENGNGLVDCEFAYGQCFLEIVYAKPVRRSGCDGPHGLDAMAVSIRFDNRHDGGPSSHDRTESFEIVLNRGCIDFDPGQHRNILFYGRMAPLTEISGPPADSAVSGNWIFDRIDDWAKREPNRRAFVLDQADQTQEFTYADVIRFMNGIAADLEARGVRSGDRIG